MAVLRVHRYWTGTAPVPAISAAATPYLSKLGFLTDWTDDTLPPDIKAAVDAADGGVPRFEHSIQRRNVARLHLLRTFGGLWVEHDVLVLYLPGDDAPWSAWAGTSICPDVLRCDADEPLLTSAINAIAPAESATKSSGAAMLGHVWGSTNMRYQRLPYDSAQRFDPTAKNWAIHTWDDR